MNMRKFGSDPAGSQVNIERLEKSDGLQSIKFGKTAQDAEIEDKERTKLFPPKKDWSLLDAGDHDPNYADGRSYDEGI